MTAFLKCGLRLLLFHTRGGKNLRISRVLSNFVVLGSFCVFLISIVPCCTVDTIHLNSTSQANGNEQFVVEECLSTLSSDEPVPQTYAAMAYDSESDRMIVFESSGYIQSSGYTWAYDVNVQEWTNMSPAVSPAGWFGGQMVYDEGSDRIIQYDRNETWVYDYNSNTWVNMTTAISPGFQDNMAYDSESDATILFGDNQTWAYDFESNTWTNMSPALHPLGRSGAGFAYDNESDRIILFGGALDSTSQNDTWSYNYNTNTWTQMNPIISPSARTSCKMSYDSGSDRIILFGGFLSGFWIGSAPGYADTWSYDYNSDKWTQMSQELYPSSRYAHCLAYDSESDLIMLFGGGRTSPMGARPREDNIWIYDYDRNFWNNVDWDWQEVTPRISPGATENPGMVYDVESDLVVLFGGEPIVGLDNYVGFNETWIYDYNIKTWTNMSPSVAPPSRMNTEMVYDYESDIIILFGGYAKLYEDPEKRYYNDTWAYDVNTNTWTEMAPAIAPSSRFEHSMTYDSKIDRIILFSGQTGSYPDSNETWQYDYNTNTWALMNPEDSPKARLGSELVYDEESEVSILYGGFEGGDEALGYIWDTWIYNSTADSWTEMHPAYEPSAPSYGRTVYDSSVDRVILFGGAAYKSPSMTNQTWSYDFNTNSWFEMNTPNSPHARVNFGLAFDSESNQTILFGGGGYPFPTSNETWAYKYQINTPPQPLSLEITANGENLVLTWEAPRVHPETPITGYKVYRGERTGDYSLLTSLGDVLTYTDTSVIPGTTYYYVVTAVTSVGEGVYSPEASGVVEVQTTPTRTSPTTSTTPTTSIPTGGYDPESPLQTIAFAVSIGSIVVIMTVVVLIVKNRAEGKTKV
jgi:hypothetical protein